MRSLSSSGTIRTIVTIPAAIAGAFAFLACAGIGDARAIPRYAAAYGQDCNLCHHDPTGGGLRDTYASQYLVPTELAWRADSSLEGIEPAIGEHLLLGADLRLLATDAEDETSRLLTMQSDVHVVLRLDETTSVAIDVGAGRRSEAWGLARVLPWQGWMKAGRFVPAYGWRFADHQVYPRRHLLATEGERSPAAWEDAGLELGLSPGSAQLSASAQAGAGDVGESWTLRAVERESFGPVDLSLGVSSMRRQQVDGHRSAHGVFGSWNVGPLSWLGQADVVRAADRRREWILTQQLAWTFVRGWTALLMHDFHDPDRDRRSGVRRRWGAGLDVLLTPFVGFTALARYEDPDPGSAVTGDERLRADVVLHFLF